ncbi:MAG: hypothetical protein BGO21_30820 [Dyadobacter sp. 50-39]|uniref:YaiO family outer membrane beta-barrel protein n=1 Tax=Dyadobacter sp. 50-39 TaxID=1895756 RepID=UPI00096A167F|nr:YaiO family outer membrane beta-barrel protein [Dyadobacter sp. 50-39]OJV19395.1 MAG: hypothetical protein BGO21_30820 [Dyadobacter sp. 50-39]
MSIFLKSILILFFLFLSKDAFCQTWNTVRAERLYQKGKLEYSSGQIKSSVKDLEQALVLNDKHIDARVLLTKLYIEDRKFSSAIKAGLIVLKQSPQYEDVYYYLISAALQNKLYYDALGYVDKALKYYPKNKIFLIKKLGMLDMLNQFAIGDQFGSELLRKFKGDKQVRIAMAGHYEAKGDWYRKKKIPIMARKSYESSIELVPDNTDTRDKLLKLMSDEEGSPVKLARINQNLAANPASYDDLMRKLGVMQDERRYAEAIEILKQMLRIYPNDPKAIAINREIWMEAGSFYQHTDPYNLYTSVLEKDATNRDALQKVYGLAISQGDVASALHYVDMALVKLPHDVDFLTKKMSLHSQQKDYFRAALAGKSLSKENITPKLKTEIVEVSNTCGSWYLREQLPDSALSWFGFSLALNPKDFTALNGRVGALMAANQSEPAIDAISQALSIFPDHVELAIKRASLLAEKGKVNEACEASEVLYGRYPSDVRISTMHIEYLLLAGQSSMTAEEYDRAERYFLEVLNLDKGNKLALNYLTNLLDYTQRYKKAAYYVKYALSMFPDDREMRLKQSSILFNMGQYHESALVAKDLLQKFPFNPKYKSAYVDGFLAAAGKFSKSGLLDSALYCYDLVLAVKPSDSLSHFGKIRVLNELSYFSQALEAVEAVERYYDDSEKLLATKVELLDQLGLKEAALAHADTLYKRYPIERNKEVYNLLRSKVSHNQVGVAVQHTSFANGEGVQSKYMIATMSYRKYLSNGSFAGRLVFSGRDNGTGIMLEAEADRKHGNNYHSTATIGFSNNVVLPRLRVAYSLSKILNNKLSADVGVRYISIDSINSFSLFWGATRQIKDISLSGKIYAILENGNFYAAANASGRYDLNEKEYVQISMSLGSSPDDRSRLLLYPSLSGVLGKTLGTSYQRSFNHRTIVNVSGYWTNQKIAPESFRNQYDISLAIFRKF